MLKRPAGRPPHARAITFQLTEAAVGGALFTRILAAIQRLRAPPASGRSNSAGIAKAASARKNRICANTGFRTFSHPSAAVDIAGTQSAPFQVAEPVEHEERVQALRLEMTIPGSAFLSTMGLRAMGRADRTVHVRCDPFGRHRGVSPINRSPLIRPPTPRSRTAPHPAGRRSLGINATPSDHLPHHRIERRTIRVIHIIISGRSPEDRLAQKPDHGMQTVVDGSRISERTAGNIVQSRGLVQRPERQRATVGTDLRAMGFQLYPPAAPDCRNRA